jgi:hypothetical protein
MTILMPLDGMADLVESHLVKSQQPQQLALLGNCCCSVQYISAAIRQIGNGSLSARETVLEYL